MLLYLYPDAAFLQMKLRQSSRLFKSTSQLSVLAFDLDGVMMH